VRLVDGSTRELDVPFDSVEEAIQALQNGHVPFRGDWVEPGDGGLIRKSSIIEVTAGEESSTD
jgi:hypothetical protein